MRDRGSPWWQVLGTRFRNTLYPGEMSGVLRLHSTYRHDLKIYSSDEGTPAADDIPIPGDDADTRAPHTRLHSLTSSHGTGRITLGKQ